MTALNNTNSLQACYTAFGVGTQHCPERIHRDELPDPPNTWYELQSHSHKEGFLQAAEKEYEDLFRRNTFKKVERLPKGSVLPVH